MAKLVIVESPAKAKTIEKYLGKDYMVAASVGHVMDLPKKSLGVDLEKDFAPSYEVLPEKKKTVSKLKLAAKDSEEIYLAPDPDREGEAIAWHLYEILKKTGKPMKRVRVNEITRQAVIKAIGDAGELDRNRYEAQQARRVLDRLVGYLISPLLSKKLKGSLSAGRVQSVALRLVVERERAIRAFQPQEYWSVEALLAASAPPEFKAKLAQIKGKSVETPGERFNDKKHVFIRDEKEAKKIVEAVSSEPFIVGSVSRSERRRHPPPPFITSTLQQDAARKLGFTAKKTMMLAQRLYEGQDVGDGPVGLITYMRTDSPRVADQAIDMVRTHIHDVYGPEYLPRSPRTFKSKKTAQEAHEAIRPTVMKYTPEVVKDRLDPDMARLYELIYLRFLASQMRAAMYDQTSVDVPVGDYLFRAGGRVLKFKGFLAVYEEAADEDAEKEGDMALPPLNDGDRLDMREIIPERHFTKPPPRFTEASLVRELEEKGIGRPSTYAQTLSTIQDRKYVEKEQKRFHATPLGERITDILVAAFPEVMEVGFTAQMEADLDKIEEGDEDWIRLLRRFYGPFSTRLDEARKILDEMKNETPTDLPCPVCGNELMIKWSKKGEFLGCSGYPECKFTTDFDRDEKGEVVPRQKEIVQLDVPCPQCGGPLQIREGRKGEFVGCSAYPDCTFTSDFTRSEAGEIELSEQNSRDTDVVCDKCGKPMAIKKTRQGGREFLACTGYPKCKNAKDFEIGEDGKIIIIERKTGETDIKCDKCQRPMAIKVARRTGKEFLACTGYPKCKNAKDFERDKEGNIRVLSPGDEGEACENCGKPMVAKRGRSGLYWACTDYPDCKTTKAIGGGELAPAAKKSAPKAGPELLPDEPVCEKCGSPMVRRQGRFGPFIACSGYPACKNIRKKKKSDS